jgi:hypothetical protein
MLAVPDVTDSPAPYRTGAGWHGRYGGTGGTLTRP